MLKLVVLAVLFVAVMGGKPQHGGGQSAQPRGEHPQKRIVRQLPNGMSSGRNPMGGQGGGSGGSFPGMPDGMNPADMATKAMDTAQKFGASVISGRRRRNV